MTSLEDKIKLAMQLDEMGSPPTSPGLPRQDSSDNKEQVQFQSVVAASPETKKKPSQSPPPVNDSIDDSVPMDQEEGGDKNESDSPEIKKHEADEVSKGDGTVGDRPKKQKKTTLDVESVSNGELKSEKRQSTSPGTNKLYERAFQQRAALEKKREEFFKKDHSFSPKLVSSKKLRENRATTPGKTRSEMLYEEATSRKHKEKEMQAKNPELQECTFKPRTNTSKQPMTRGVSPAKRAESLYMGAKQLEEKRKALMEQRLKEEAKECSFKPKITAKAKAARPPSPNPSARVMELQQQYREKAQQKLAVKEQRELEGCTFQPKINRRRSSGVAAPVAGSVQDRLSMYQRQLEEKREALRKKHEEQIQKELTFRPRISRPGTPTRAPQGSIHERLYHEAESRSHRQATDPQLEERKKRPSSAPRARQSMGTFERLSTPKKPVQTGDREDHMEVEELKECTFTPNVRTSIGSTGSKPREGGDAVFERLHRESLGNTDLQVDAELSECTFTPKITRSSLSPGSGGKPVWERLNEEARKLKEREDEMERARQEKELAECSFQPKISKGNSTQVSGGKPIWERLSDTSGLKEKQKQFEKQREEAEIKECTFQPKGSPKKTSAKTITPVLKTPSYQKANSSYLEKVRSSARSSSTKKKQASGSQESRLKSPVSGRKSPKSGRQSPDRATSPARFPASSQNTPDVTVSSPPSPPLESGVMTSPTPQVQSNIGTNASSGEKKEKTEKKSEKKKEARLSLESRIAQAMQALHLPGEEEEGDHGMNGVNGGDKSPDELEDLLDLTSPASEMEKSPVSASLSPYDLLPE